MCLNVFKCVKMFALLLGKFTLGSSLALENMSSTRLLEMLDEAEFEEFVVLLLNVSLLCQLFLELGIDNPIFDKIRLQLQI